MEKIGIVLSGCGVMDGSEIHESVLTLLAVAENGGQAICMAPDVEQAHVVNHLTNKEMKEKRNVLVESARIARGNIRDVKNVQVGDVDALIFPGGYGAAKNLCSFAFDGPECKVNPEVERLLREVRQEGKPIGAICISPVLMAKIFQGDSLQLTIGTDKETANAIQTLGQKHMDCGVRETCVDHANRVVTTPAYMLAKNLPEAYAGIKKLVTEVLNLIKQPASNK